MPGVCLCHKEIDRFPSSSTAPKSEILGDQIALDPIPEFGTWNYIIRGFKHDED